MKFFNFFKTKTNESFKLEIGSYFETKLSDTSLIILINDAISIFQLYTTKEPDQIIETINFKINDQDLAVALYRFIPLAYCRLFIPEVQYSDKFVLLDDEKNEKSFLFTKEKLFQLTLEVCKKRLLIEKDQDKIFPILMHSANFNAINEALNNGSQLNNLNCSPSYFL